MARKPGKISISSLAGELGVSVATISRVMNNRIGVNEEKRRKVLAYLRENNFRINYPRQRGAKIAVVTEHANLSSYVSLILQGIYGYSRTTDLQINVLIYEKHLREPLLSILRDDERLAYGVRKKDEELDQLYATEMERIFHNTSSAMFYNFQTGTCLLFILRAIERIGDHAKELAIPSFYLLTAGGRSVDEKRCAI